jgi:hypothetical protein
MLPVGKKEIYDYFPCEDDWGIDGEVPEELWNQLKLAADILQAVQAKVREYVEGGW